MVSWRTVGFAKAIAKLKTHFRQGPGKLQGELQKP